MDRKELALIICKRLEEEKTALQEQYTLSSSKIGHFFIDNLLPENIALNSYNNFPELKNTISKKNIREFKHIAYQMDKYSPLLEELIYAFQEKNVVEKVAEICNVDSIFPDEYLYAGGLSLMTENNFLNPHLDNSHDKDRNQWRVFNLLYYVSPNWRIENGGNLELWPKGIHEKQLTIESKFNRLVLMATHQNSWHSVSKVKVKAIRCCVSNYYFSSKPLLSLDTFHITTFRGRPKQKLKDFILQIDNNLRSRLRKLFKNGVRKNTHQYKK